MSSDQDIPEWEQLQTFLEVDEGISSFLGPHKFLFFLCEVTQWFGYFFHKPSVVACHS